MIVLTPNTVTVNVSTTLTPVSNGTTLMLSNSNGRESLIRLYAANTTNQIGSFFLTPNSMVALVKGADDTINASPQVAATVVKLRI